MDITQQAGESAGGSGAAAPWAGRVLGDVTAELLPLPALAEADELAEEEAMMLAMMRERDHGAAMDMAAYGPARSAWGARGAEQEEEEEAVVGGPGNITAALPPLSALVEEDEDAYMLDGGGIAGRSAGMAAGRDSTFGASPSAHPQQQQQRSDEEDEGLAMGGVRGDAAQPTPCSDGGRGGVTEELLEDGRPTVQKSKWGFVPGVEDTLDIDLKAHGEGVGGVGGGGVHDDGLKTFSAVVIKVKCPEYCHSRASVLGCWHLVLAACNSAHRLGWHLVLAACNSAHRLGWHLVLAACNSAHRLGWPKSSLFLSPCPQPPLHPFGPSPLQASSSWVTAPSTASTVTTLPPGPPSWASPATVTAPPIHWDPSLRQHWGR
jgi:hypothetical protein